MAISDRATIISLDGIVPEISPTAWVAPGAVVVGNVKIGPGASVWYNTVLRGDSERIIIGENSNIQDSCTFHADPGYPLQLGAAVTVGHGAILHGADVGSGSLVGMGARLLNGARVGTQSLIAAGALLTEGFEAPSQSLIVGAPASLKRPLKSNELQLLGEASEEYLESAALHEGRSKIR